MRLTVVRLRRGILLLGGLLLVILIGFFVYAHYRLGRFERSLPARLGVNIEQTADGYTYSQSRGGHTLFTIHASKLIEFRHGGNASLRDVSITLYGPVGSTRTDRISGKSFDYDAKDGIIRAAGAVEIDLQGLGAASPANMIHVKTSGLVFNQKTGEADTADYTEFAFPEASGNAVGVHYDSRTGVLLLSSHVHLKTVAGAHPVRIEAASAELERANNAALLTSPHALYQGERSSADSALVVFHPDGTAESIGAQGDVRVTTAAGTRVSSSRSMTIFDGGGRPEQTQLTGGVEFASTGIADSMHGTAKSGTLFFSSGSTLRQARFRGGVHVVDQQFGGRKQQAVVARRDMTSKELDVNFLPGPARRGVLARTALATVNAALELDATQPNGAPQRTFIYANELRAHFTPGGRFIHRLDGAGRTRLVELSSDGSAATSTGDTLQAVFREPHSKAKRGTGLGSMQIVSVVQHGGVELTRTPKEHPEGAAQPVAKAWAQSAAYDGLTGVTGLSGSPRLEDGQGLELSAAQIGFNRVSGDVSADGDVKATYSQRGGPAAAPMPAPGGDGPVHITASRAFLVRASGLSTFYGSRSTDARLWQGPDTILAPVIVLRRSPGTLAAHGARGISGPQVRAILAAAQGSRAQGETVRIESRTLFYTEAARRADFQGGVLAQSASGDIRSDQAQVFLTPASARAESGSAAGRGELERIVATGRVRLTQPGRTGTGSRLVYTSADGRYVLTGTAADPPRIVDLARGATTGRALIFNSRNDSVWVSGGPSGAITTARSPK